MQSTEPLSVRFGYAEVRAPAAAAASIVWAVRSAISGHRRCDTARLRSRDRRCAAFRSKQAFHLGGEVAVAPRFHIERGVTCEFLDACQVAGDYGRAYREALRNRETEAFHSRREHDR